MAQLDATVVGIAQPAIGRDFHATIAGLQWVSAGYLLTVAGLILLAGALCDRFGRRLVFTIGVAWFAVASLICAVAPNIGLLIAARMLQGVGGALLTPGSLAILQASFAKEERGRVIGAWSGLGGVATLGHATMVYLQRFAAILCQDDVITGAAQDSFHHAARYGVIICHKNLHWTVS